MKIKSILLCILSILIITATSCVNKLTYSTGKDTAEYFGDGRYQIMRSYTDIGDYVKYILYDCKTNETIVDDVFGFTEKNNVIYLWGYHWPNDDVYGAKYIVINENNSIIEKDNANKFSTDIITIFNEINRYVGFLENDHYTNKFESKQLQYPISADTVELFCDGKYQIIYGCLVNNYPYFLYDSENNSIITKGFFGYTEKNNKYFLLGYVNDSDYVPKYIIINKKDSSIIETTKKRDLSKQEKEIFNNISKY